MDGLSGVDPSLSPFGTAVSRIGEAPSLSHRFRHKLVANVFIDQVKKSYGSVVALHDITFIFRQGHFLRCWGPVAAARPPCCVPSQAFIAQDQGSISVGGEVLDSIPVHQRDIGMVFQDYAIFPHLSSERIWLSA